MTSVNYDASVGWYPSENLFLEAAAFYKDIENFIVDVLHIPFDHINASGQIMDVILDGGKPLVEGLMK